ncbi:MAG: integration host factor, actinobacterial type [Actinomycetota bacterium]|nr:integration host factor, actinobacterial type [Actinomycetota bacterium]
MALPRLTDAERKAALRKALEVRRQRAALKASVKKGQTSLSSVLSRPSDPIVGKMKVSALLESLPGIGKARSRRLMEKLSIDSSRRVQGLGSRQRELLLKELS